MGRFQPPVVSFRLGFNHWLLDDPSRTKEPDSSQHPMLDQRLSMANPTPFCLFGSSTSNAVS
ncbi:hypothetical protein J1N35_039391 [Gossypium stocksii]|uniref:Uncharacterized protein n=1 Tax=Gossypium stocksii TaxID=47602 RepID=A0A9D3UNR7_9ROSI|nr:hypothetical protein J1N35_039391 [Gossypium stocksii]